MSNKIKIKAEFKPKDLDKYSSIIVDAQGFKGEWEFAFQIGGINYYYSDDVGFPSTDVFPETDLRVIQ